VLSSAQLSKSSKRCFRGHLFATTTRKVNSILSRRNICKSSLVGLILFFKIIGDHLVSTVIWLSTDSHLIFQRWPFKYQQMIVRFIYWLTFTDNRFKTVITCLAYQLCIETDNILNLWIFRVLPILMHIEVYEKYYFFVESLL